MVKLTMLARVADGLPLAEGLDSDRAQDLEPYKQQAKTLFKLSQGPPPPSRMSYESGPYFLHDMIEAGVCYLTLSDRGYPKKLAYQYLEDLQREFSAQNGAQIETVARPYAFIKFDTFIQKTKKLYQDTRTQRNLNKLNEDLHDIQSVMTRNIQDILGQGERLDHVSNMSETLRNESRKYSDKAKDLSRQALIRNTCPSRWSSGSCSSCSSSATSCLRRGDGFRGVHSTMLDALLHRLPAFEFARPLRSCCSLDEESVRHLVPVRGTRLQHARLERGLIDAVRELLRLEAEARVFPVRRATLALLSPQEVPRVQLYPGLIAPHLHASPGLRVPRRRALEHPPRTARVVPVQREIMVVSPRILPDRRRRGGAERAAPSKVERRPIHRRDLPVGMGWRQQGCIDPRGRHAVSHDVHARVVSAEIKIRVLREIHRTRSVAGGGHDGGNAPTHVAGVGNRRRR